MMNFKKHFDDDGVIYTHAIESLKHTNFHFLIADGPTYFITSNNPSFVFIREDGLKEGFMPLTPRILISRYDPTKWLKHGKGCGLDVRGCGTRIIVRADRSLSHSILRSRLGSGIDNRRIWDMAEKYTDDKLYRVVRKDGSHLNTKVNLDGTKSALQFTDEIMI